MKLQLKRTPGIYLVGFMGSGKTTIGKRLADHLGWPFADLDADIEAQTGMSISRLFEQQGEAAFRAAEAIADEKLRYNFLLAAGSSLAKRKVKSEK